MITHALRINIDVLFQKVAAEDGTYNARKRYKRLYVHLY
jgi:hypothetical protein